MRTTYPESFTTATCIVKFNGACTDSHRRESQHTTNLSFNWIPTATPCVATRRAYGGTNGDKYYSSWLLTISEWNVSVGRTPKILSRPYESITPSKRIGKALSIVRLPWNGIKLAKLSTPSFQDKQIRNYSSINIPSPANLNIRPTNGKNPSTDKPRSMQNPRTIHQNLMPTASNKSKKSSGHYSTTPAPCTAPC